METMRYLCLIHLNEQELDALPPRAASDLNARHLDLNDELRRSGNFISAEALEPARTTKCVRLRAGKLSVTDGPYTESKEMVAGFYLLEARDLDEAIQLAARLPSASLGTVEVRPARQLHVDGREPRWG